MTPVKFEFLGPDGQPIANQVFEIKLPKSGFLDGSDGVVMPDTLNPVTDSDGTVTLSLAPSSTPYFLKVLSPDADAGEDCCQPGIYYKFYVPIASHVVRVQDIIIDPPPSTRAYDEAALLIIIESKVISLDAAARAQASAEAAAASEQSVADDAEAARISAEAAALSELNSGNSEQASKASEQASKASEDASKASELAAEAAADFAAGAVTDMQEQVDEATEQAGIATAAATAANDSKIAAGLSATASAADVVATHADVVTTTADKAATAADVVTVTGLKSEVTDLKDETEGYRNETAAMVGSLGAIIVDGGPIDLSGGAYPAAPVESTMWKVTVGGTVTGPQGDTYGVGDTLMYSKQPSDLFYKIDNTENVSSVAGKTGVVVLNKADVGLPLADNTADANKPVSTPQLNALNLKVAIADIINNLTSTAIDKPLSAAQGKALYDLVQANNVTLVMFEYLATAGQTVFTGVDINGLTLLYTPGTGTIVLRNGVQIERNVDYTATSGSSVTVLEPCELNDLVQVMAFGTFSVANHYTKPEEDALLLTKANKASTDASFASINTALSDRYTKAQTDTLLNGKVDNTDLIAVAQGGASPAFIDGLAWEYTGVDTVTVYRGAAYCPYAAGGRIVVVDTPIQVYIPAGAANSRVHLYLHDDNNDGVPAIAIDSATPSYNYWGEASTHSTNVGWRYIGSVQRNSVGSAVPQRCSSMGEVEYFVNSNSNPPFEMLTTTGQTTARFVSISGVAPGTTKSVTVQIFAGTVLTRLAAAASVTGFTVVAGGACTITVASNGIVVPIAVGSDLSFQYVSDTAGNGLVIRILGYTCRR